MPASSPGPHLDCPFRQVVTISPVSSGTSRCFSAFACDWSLAPVVVTLGPVLSLYQLQPTFTRQYEEYITNQSSMILFPSRSLRAWCFGKSLW